LAAAWLARWPEESMRRKGVMGNVLAFGHKTAGSIDDGLQVITETRRWLEQAEGYYALSWTSYLEAVLHMKRGSWLEARLACVMGLELVGRELEGHRGQSSMFHALLAGIAYEFDEVDVAAGHVEHAMSSVDECSHADAVIIAYLTQARIERLRRDEGSACAILREGQELGERRGLRRVTLSLAAEECTGLARAGRSGEAQVVAARFGFGELHSGSGAAGLTHDKALRAASRFILLKSPLAVATALDEAIASCQRRGLAHRLVELLLIRALAHQAVTDRHGAEADLSEALAIAAPRGYLRVFIDEGPALISLIGRLDLEGQLGDQAAPLLRRLQQSATRADGDLRDNSGTGDTPLTRRELSVLKRLESGLSNKEIAEAIFVSEGTLKWHLHNVYSKLDVKNRSGAIARAKGLGLL
jgi:ATP/maltotriose-dependent transcriptional regulator MalT